MTWNKIRNNYIYWFLIFLLHNSFILFSCYSLKDASVDPRIAKFSVETFTNNAFNSRAGIEFDFSEKLKRKIESDTRISYSEELGDIAYSGAIKSYIISSVSPTLDDQNQPTSSLNRLHITVQIDFQNKFDEKLSWSQTFDHYLDFEASSQLSDIEENLTNEIFDEIIQKIITKSFSNW